ncbi:hypothetical protein QGM71_17860 [Virgibacillus sp. C22-A2]|uniref:Uncharacterized protein n=1 Tax=Virgibacillus tibetensis TaxID=3042313 RepID=A0ABU6KJE3_9BACI|nr:hypothetical protein [Virgibacillus sp. C22-A2]
MIQRSVRLTSAMVGDDSALGHNSRLENLAFAKPLGDALVALMQKEIWLYFLYC